MEREFGIESQTLSIEVESGQGSRGAPSEISG
jgi:hypothetical protein